MIKKYSIYRRTLPALAPLGALLALVACSDAPPPRTERPAATPPPPARQTVYHFRAQEARPARLDYQGKEIVRRRGVLPRGWLAQDFRHASTFAAYVVDDVALGQALAIESAEGANGVQLLLAFNGQDPQGMEPIVAEPGWRYHVNYVYASRITNATAVSSFGLLLNTETELTPVTNDPVVTRMTGFLEGRGELQSQSVNLPIAAHWTTNTIAWDASGPAHRLAFIFSPVTHAQGACPGATLFLREFRVDRERTPR